MLVTRFLMFLAVAGCGRLGFDPLSAVTSDAGGDAGSMGLLAAWSFDEGVGLVAHDASGHGNDLNLVGTPQWVAGMPIRRSVSRGRRAGARHRQRRYCT